LKNQILILGKSQEEVGIEEIRYRPLLFRALCFARSPPNHPAWSMPWREGRKHLVKSLPCIV